MMLCGGPAIHLFSATELERLVCGNPSLDFAALQANSRYDGGYSADHRVRPSHPCYQALFNKLLHCFHDVLLSDSFFNQDPKGVANVWKAEGSTRLRAPTPRASQLHAGFLKQLRVLCADREVALGHCGRI